MSWSCLRNHNVDELQLKYAVKLACVWSFSSWLGAVKLLPVDSLAVKLLPILFAVKLINVDSFAV